MSCKRRYTRYTCSEVEWINTKHSYNYYGDAKGGKINQQVINQGSSWIQIPYLLASLSENVT